MATATKRLSEEMHGAVEQAEDAVQDLLRADLVYGITPRDLVEAFRRFARVLAVNPRVVVKKEAQLVRELGRILLGRSQIKPPPRDLRFRHRIWEESPYYRRVLQAYLVWRKAMFDILASADADPRDKERARFLLMQIVEAAAPTNNPLGNPGFVDRLVKTRGRSLFRGLSNFVHDMRHNHGMPRQVDAGAFRVGKDLATSPGRVVFRNEVCEVLQYQPSTERVHARPVLIVPPQVNKYYIVDLAPDKSFVKYAVDHGVQTFTISWRNPGPEHAHWNIDTYVGAVLEAIEVVRSISREHSIDIVGACAGGLTTIAALGYLQATGRLDRINSQTLLVTSVDMSQPMLLGLFATGATMRAARQYARRRGLIDGSELARVFAWLRPSDLVWLFFANNYLMGNDPPAFDFLYWNNDSTRLPAGFHCDAVDVFERNPFMRPRGVKVKGRRIDPGAIDVDHFVVAGIKDHIIPWRSCYPATQVLGGRKRFILGSSGHIQAVVAPPGKKNARYYVNEDYVPDPDEWLNNAGMRQGSWWPEWLEWKTGGGEPDTPAPEELGNERYPAGDMAPGYYVFT